jgi:hypothetical protein
MVSTIPYVFPPADMVFRVNRRGRPLFQPPNWALAGAERRFGGRYDDPAGTAIPENYRFRAIYCGTSRAAALGEVIAGKGLRPDLKTVVKLQEIETDSPANPGLLKFYISEEWRSARWLETAKLDESLRFADMEASETLGILRLVPHLARKAQELTNEGKLADFGRSALYGPHTLTQHLARYIYEQVDIDNRPMYAGIHYASRLNATWECWAIFDSRIRREIGFPETILHDNSGLREVSGVFKLPIETYGRKLICPWLEDDDCSGWQW